jgi:hypothetical protein
MSDRTKMKRQPKRSLLLVILGAGSTIHAGAPSTKEITERVCKLEDESIHSVVSRLRDQRSEGNFNFETVLVFRRNHRIPYYSGACDNARCARGSISR